MCEICAVSGALVFTVLYFVLHRKGKVGLTVCAMAVVFWCETLMWTIEGLSNLMVGWPFFLFTGPQMLWALRMMVSNLVLGLILFLIEKLRKGH